VIGNFYRAYSGLEVNSRGLEANGNNLSNMNTVGFKRTGVNFEQLMSSVAQGASGTGAPIQFGLGAKVAETVNIFRQGPLQRTGIETNLALQGSGFFMVDLGNRTGYTRAGNFNLNSAGNLVTAGGATVQGYTDRLPDGTIDPNGAVGPITIAGFETAAATATTNARLVTNLSAAAEEGETFVSSIDVFDATGTRHTLDVVYTKTATAGEWTYSTRVDGAAVTDVAGTMQFDSNGDLTTVDGVALADVQNPQITVALPNGEGLDLTWELVTDGAGTVTNLGENSNTVSVFGDGAREGSLEQISFDQNGVMRGFYDNGEVLEIAQIALARFPNNAGLQQLSGGLFTQTAASGEALMDAIGNTTVLAGALETSNVDIAEEFTSLIIHQRGYQSNAKTVTTTDQMLQEVLGLKR